MGKIITVGVLIFATIALIFFYSNNAATSFNNISTQTLHQSNIDSTIFVQLKNTYQLGRKQWNYEGAMILLDSLIDNPNFIHAQDSSKANTFHKKGAYEHMLGNFEPSIEFTSKALKIRTKLQAIPDSILAENYYVRAKSYDELGKTELALQDIKESIQLTEDKTTSELSISNYHVVAAKLYLQMGDSESFKIYAEQAIDKYENNTFPDVPEYVNLISNVGVFYQNEGKFPEALKAYQRVEDIVKNYDQILHHSQSKMNQGNIYYFQKDFQKAKEIYLEVLEMINARPNQANKLRIIKRQTLNNLALTVYRLDGDVEGYGKYIRQVIELEKLANAEHGVFLGAGYKSMGDYFIEKKSYPKAIEQYHLSVKSLCVGYNNQDIFSTPNIETDQILNYRRLRKNLLAKMDALRTLYESENNVLTLQHIYKHYLTLDSVNFVIRQNYEAGSARFKFVAKTLPDYEQAIAIMLKLHTLKNDDKYLESAYHFAARNKAIVILDGLQNKEALLTGIPPDLLETENEIQGKYYQLESKLYDLKQGNKTDQIKATRSERFDLIRQYRQLIDRYEKEYPAYYQLKYGHQASNSSKELAGQLPEKAAIIEFFIGSKDIYIFTISKKNGLQSQIVSKPKDFKKLCADFIKATEDNKGSTLSDFSKTSNMLYTLLLEDCLDELQKNQVINRLMIVPDGALFQISLDAFLENEVESDATWASSNLPYLLKKYAISYAYSNQLIFDKNKSTKISNNLKPYTGFGLEYTDTITLQGLNKLADLKVDTVLSRGMGKLFYSDDEVNEIAAITGGKAYINDQALKSVFLKQSPNAKIIHLAMHGYVTLDQPLNSGLIFKRKNLNDDDYVLKAAELYSHSLKAELAVLSACHTGSGNLQKGEGVRSLARAFHYAGCPAIVASLWSAPDFSTKEIIVQYFENLKIGTPKDVALQQAKLSFFQNTPETFTHPNYWTHLIAIGDNQSISF